jgi:hypothetical protein
VSSVLDVRLHEVELSNRAGVGNRALDVVVGTRQRLETPTEVLRQQI